MTCDETSILLHALVDGELDAGNARDVEAHIAQCSECAAQLLEIHQIRKAMVPGSLRFAAPSDLRSRIEGKLPAPRAVHASRRSVLKGLSIGASATALAASGVLVMVMRAGDDRRVLGEVVSAHLRSLQGDHLTDVLSTDQHTVKPWFNGKLDVAPPVVDLTSLGFTLLGGRLDYVDAKPVAAIVYRRRIHVINLFCAPAPASARRSATMESLHGFNVRSWTENGLSLWAVSDINPEELTEFGDKFEKAVKQ
ncbi:MAG TPA: anti-sigma factor [Pseudolabrys sp.]